MLIVRDELQGMHVENTMVLDLLEFKQANLVEFWELGTNRELNVEKRTRASLHIDWELELFLLMSPK